MSEPITVLIADDHLVVRAGMKEVLRREPAIVRVIGEADSAQGAVQQALALRPQVLIMDLAWYKDRKAGIDAIQRIKQEAPQIRILAMTAYPELIEEARAAGADMAVEKDSLTNRATLIKHISTTFRAPLPATSLELRLEELSEREREVLRLVAQGATDEQIANQLQIALPTAKKHVSSLLRKLSAANRSAAVAIAYETGLLTKGDFFNHKVNAT